MIFLFLSICPTILQAHTSSLLPSTRLLRIEDKKFRSTETNVESAILAMNAERDGKSQDAVRRQHISMLTAFQDAEPTGLFDNDPEPHWKLPPWSQPSHIVADNHKMMSKYINITKRDVMKWSIQPADPKATDRIVVVFAPHGFEETTPPYFGLEYSLRATLNRLGKHWGLHVFHATSEARKQIEAKIGHGAANTIFSQISNYDYDGDSRNCYYNRWCLTKEPYQVIDRKHEHILFIQPDSFVFRANCVEKFFTYGYVGAPWPSDYSGGPENRFGGNGGLSLRRRSVMLNVLEAFGDAGRCPYPEDFWLSRAFRVHNQSLLATNEEARGFASEDLHDPESQPCGMHKPWNHLKTQELVLLLQASLSSLPLTAARKTLALSALSAKQP